VFRALETTGADYYAENRNRLQGRIETFCEALDAAGAEYDRPEGGFYVMARFEGFPGTFENVFELIDEAGVAGMPGEGLRRVAPGSGSASPSSHRTSMTPPSDSSRTSQYSGRRATRRTPWTTRVPTRRRVENEWLPGPH